MHKAEALLIGALTRMGLRNRDMRCVLLTAPVEEYGVSYEDIKHLEVDWPGYPAGGVPVDNSVSGSAFETISGMEEIVLLGWATLPNKSEAEWPTKVVHTAYYLADTPLKNVLWTSTLHTGIETVGPGQTLTVSPVSIR